MVWAGMVIFNAASASEPLVIDVNAAIQFATLPDGVRYPEGIAANPATGDIYVATFDFGPNANKLMRFSKNGQLSAIRDFGGTPMLGLGFGPTDDKVYILNMGTSKVQRIAAQFDSNTAVEDVASVPNILAPGPRAITNPDGTNDTITFGSNGFPAPNGMVFDRSGNLYFSDSFQGAIFKIANVASCTKPCAVTTVAHDPLLATAGFPPFGANGIALSADESAMFIANTGDNRVLKMDMASNAISVFAESVHGADGVVFDDLGRLWVCANQADQVVALSETGRMIARLGSFLGIRKDGTPNGLLFPASPVIVGGWMYVTNLALPLTGGDEPERDVTRWTVSRMKLPSR
ncbi:MAG: SMP-30/gluconolactonase/LRE family protein [Betaproteobacteria bacterium]